VKKSNTSSDSDSAFDFSKETEFVYKCGLSICISSSLNHQIILFRVFLNGLIVVSTTFSGKDSISSHVNGI
jgi:hypothetical protein